MNTEKSRFTELEVELIEKICASTGFSADSVADALVMVKDSSVRASFEIDKLVLSLPSVRQFEPKKGGKRRGSRRWRNGKR
jgi:hypothetical protein